MDDAVQTVMTQCELWTDNNDMRNPEGNIVGFNVGSYTYLQENGEVFMVAEDPIKYGEK